jgi:fibronectin type 3 domain-containing protein
MVVRVAFLLAVALLGWQAAQAHAADPVIGAAGDIACSSTTVATDKCHQKATSDLLVNAGLSAVLTLGDAQYQSGSFSGFMGSYDKSWGRVKSITYPSVGNHEYMTSGASGYFDYFNGAGNATGRAGDRGKGYYSFDVGTWHLIALNSNDACSIVSCSAGSAQETWLKADLAAHPNYCTLAFWHHPSYNSGNGGNLSAMQPELTDLYNANADVILGGHAHHYERFAPQNASSQLDNTRGIRQFVVGTGGAFWTSIGGPKPNSQVRQNTTYGVLKLTLHPTSYDWVFAPEAGKTFTDSGSWPCHGTAGPPSDVTKPTPPGSLTATAGTGQVTLNWQASTDNVGVTGYRVWRNGSQVGSTAGTVRTYTDSNMAPGSYSYVVEATDAAGNVSSPSNTANATVLDTTKPTPPANLTATGSAGQVALSWQLATDNVGVTGYRVFRGSTQVASLGGTATSYADTGLAAGPYSYTVRAVDAATNLSDPSNTASATVPDSTKPTPPGNLTATGSPGKVVLDWQLSSDNVGVTGYRIWRNGANVATVGGTTATYSDSLNPGSYSYLVEAVDAAGNISSPSNTANATVPDVTKPSVPQNLTARANGPLQADLTWDRSTDNVAVAGYNVYREGAPIGSTGPTPSYSDHPLLPGTYHYEVEAFDAAGNVSASRSNTATITLLAPDGEPPTAPANLTATLNGTQVDLAWEASRDNIGVTGYTIYRDGAPLETIAPATSYSDMSPPVGDVVYEVRAQDASGNPSDASNTATVTVPDTEKPTPPANLTGTDVSPSRVDLTWSASADNVGVTGYDVYRDDALLASIDPATSYSDTTVTPGPYRYVVIAHDAAGHVSDPSNEATVTVKPPDNEKPTAPGNLTATPAGTGQIDLSWLASTDNVGVTGYNVYRDGAPLASLGVTTSWSDTTVSANSTYQYEVHAVDAAGHESDASNTATATTYVPQQVLTLSPEADARVESATPTTNYGTSNLRADGGADPAVESFLRFTVNGVPAGGVQTAKLRVYVYNGTVDGPAVYNSNPAWNETAVNWNNRPPRTSGARDDKGAITGKSWVEYDVTPFVTGSGTYSFDLATTSSDGVDIYSREAATLRPELVVTTGTPDKSPPTAPGNLSATANGSNRIDLSWLTSRDNEAVTGYNVYRGGTLLAGIGTTLSYSDTSVAPNTTYGYEVRALDAAGNISDPSNTATATTDPAPPAPTVLTLSPDADARTEQASPTTNYATSYLRADASSSTLAESFLRFTVTGAPSGSVLSAKLRLHSTSNGTVDGPAVFTTAAGWSETAINWNTRLSPTSAATDDKGAIPASTWVEYDVASLVPGNGTYSFRLATTSSDGVNFDSRETTGLQPQLVLTVR